MEQWGINLNMFSMTKNLHLTLSAILVFIIALTYGLFPDRILPELFDFRVETIDLKQVFRAIMGLYLGTVSLWCIGVIKPAFWRIATLSNVFFMGGLAAGRFVSLVVDGIPSVYFSVGLVVELIFACWGIGNLKKY